MYINVLTQNIMQCNIAYCNEILLKQEFAYSAILLFRILHFIAPRLLFLCRGQEKIGTMAKEIKQILISLRSHYHSVVTVSYPIPDPE